MRWITQYFTQEGPGLQTGLLQLLGALLIVACLCYVPTHVAGATLSPDKQLTPEEEWYLVQDACYHTAIWRVADERYDPEAESYAGTTGLRRFIAYENAIIDCDVMLQQRTEEYYGWVDYVYELIFYYQELQYPEDDLRSGREPPDGFERTHPELVPKYPL